MAPGQEPKNFSWLIENDIAGLGWPKTSSHLHFLVEVGVRQLITLSADRRPPFDALQQLKPELQWTELSIEEFDRPSLSQMIEFIGICERSKEMKQAVAVHCWQGRGRTGVMLACYLVRFRNMAPEMAINRVRMLRPGSVETYEQEQAVIEYHHYLRTTA